MTDEPFTYGTAPAEDTGDGPLDAHDPAPLDDLIAELGTRIDRVTRVTFDIDGRPGWWAEFDTGFSVGMIQALVARATPKRGEADALKLALLLIAETCVAIGKDDAPVFESQPAAGGGGRLAGPFKNGGVEQAIGGFPAFRELLAQRPAEKTWQAAIRWVFGAEDDERVLVQLSTALQAANAGEVVERVGERPTG